MSCSNFEKDYRISWARVEYEMLNEIYQYATAWAVANQRQILKNRILGRTTEVLYRVYVDLKTISYPKKKQYENVVVSLTTYPARINEVYYCLHSLLRQTVQPYKTILWLAKEQFPREEQSVPKRILKLRKYGLEIRFCSDFRSYKKILPTIEKYRDKVIVTADDDALYPEDWLENLISESEKYPDCVVCYRAHEMRFDDNRIYPYSQWNGLSKDVKGPSKSLVPIGVGGVLYPIYYFDGIDADYEVIKQFAPTTDDIWLKVIGIKKGISAVKVNKNSKEWFTVHGSQKSSLRSINVDESNANDLALRNLITYYSIDLFDATR